MNSSRLKGDNHLFVSLQIDYELSDSTMYSLGAGSKDMNTLTIWRYQDPKSKSIIYEYKERRFLKKLNGKDLKDDEKSF